MRKHKLWQEIRAVAGKPRDAAVNFWSIQRLQAMLFVSFDTFRGSSHGRKDRTR